MKKYLAVFVLFFTIGGCKIDSNSPANPENISAPKIQLINLKDGDIIYGNTADSTRISIQASDDKGITKVEFVVDNNVVHSWIAGPYDYDWNALFPNDSTFHLIYAKAYDADGNAATTPVIKILYRGVFSSVKMILNGYLGPNSSGEDLLTIKFELASKTIPLIVEYDSTGVNYEFNNYYVQKTNINPGISSFSTYAKIGRLYRYRVKAQLNNKIFYTSPLGIGFTPSKGWIYY